jgi:mannose-1-phosphate guanylyltransferase
MKALFLAGGLGTRLKPLTDDVPKSMVPIMNKPLLERSMANLKKHGIYDVVLSVGHKSEYIHDYFGDGRDFGMHIEYVYEDSPLGTGGAIKNTSHHFHSTFLVCNADILCNMNLTKLVEHHHAKAADVTIAVTEVSNPSAYGVIECDQHDYALSFTEKPKPSEVRSHLINAGIYVFEPHVLDAIPDGRPVSVERETFPKILLKKNAIAIYNGCSYWMDIGTPEKYLQAHVDIMTGKCKLHGVDFDKGKIFKEGRSYIDGSATITGPVYIGDNVQIGANATVGPFAVIGDHVNIHPSGSITDSILWDHVDIGSFGSMSRVVAASDCHVKRRSSHHDMAFTKTSRVAW